MNGREAISHDVGYITRIYPENAVSRKARQERKGKTTRYPAMAFLPPCLRPYSQMILNFFAPFAPLRETKSVLRLKTFQMLFIVSVFSLCFIPVPAPASSQPTPREFATGMRLTLSGKEALHELPLPVEAYRGSIRPDLGDIVVFNGSGEPVPFALIPPEAATPPVETRPLPIFPLKTHTGEAGTGLDLRVKTDATGAIINLTTGPGTTKEAPSFGFILDATKLDKPVAGIDLSWNVPPGNYLGTVQIAVSDDLEHWTTHGSGAVASLRTGGEAVDRRLIEFPAVKAKYYRLTLQPDKNLPLLTGATARLAATTARPEHRRLTILPASVKKTGNDYLFDTSGHLPIDRLSLIFPEVNTFVRVTFSSRPNDESPWQVRQRGLLYHLAQGETELATPPLEIPATTDRYWLVHVEEKGGGLGKGAPRLEIGWLPHRLVFVARGPEPFLLVFGSAREGLCNLRDDALLTTLQDGQQGRIRPAPAMAGPPETLGGIAALHPGISPATWKRWLLWGALILGVAILAGMAVRLYREIEKSES